MNDESIFASALVISDPACRAAYLDEACAGNPALRREVEALLAHAEPGSFLERSALTTGYQALGDALGEKPGDRVGPYKLLQLIGEGGMGAVWMAEQQEPVKRLVALKVIKPGMDSKAVLARFEAERQALAMMDHPNIAKVFDAGTTEAGRPYFVMELVKGVPITRFCDENKLSPRRRLELFVEVCSAIQHAHNKGVIHRDVKPSNVLVALYDDRPVVKVIDFGIAKATAGALTERTLFTQFGSVVGTFEYMSPEQAKLNALDVDTRSDVYSLGVLLYELLTGSTPFDRERLRQTALDECLRLIREEEPLRPSVRLSGSGAALPVISQNRGVEASALSRFVRGELDWIVMKALEKDRSRRYETPSALAGDVDRHLRDEHVLACPPSRWYRLSKFARKNRAALLTASAFVLMLLAATTVSAWQAWRATQAERRARDAARLALAEQQKAVAALGFLQEDVLGQANPLINPVRDVTLTAVLHDATRKLDRRFPDQPLVEADVRETIGNALFGRGEWDAALSQLDKARELRRPLLPADHADVLRPACNLAICHYNRGDRRRAEGELESALTAARQSLGEEHRVTLRLASLSAYLLSRKGMEAEAEPELARALASQRRVLCGTQNNLGKHADAERLADEGLTAVLSRPDHEARRIEEAKFLMMRGWARSGQEKFAEGDRDLIESLNQVRSAFTPRHTYLTSHLGALARSYVAQGRYDDARPLYEEALAIHEGQPPGRIPRAARVEVVLARVMISQGRFEEALVFACKSHARLRQYNSKGWHTSHALHLIGASLLGLKRYDEAKEPLIEGYKGMTVTRLAPADHPDLVEAGRRVAGLIEWHENAKAEDDKQP